jgi:choline monooxygenase
MERRRYLVACNWKVFVDNYFDSVLSYSDYTIENGERFCLQSSPLVADAADARTAKVRTGERALYFWLYPNFMINCYAGAMDTNHLRILFRRCLRAVARSTVGVESSELMGRIPKQPPRAIFLGQELP